MAGAEFGAAITLRDGFTSPISQAIGSLAKFKAQAVQATATAENFRNGAAQTSKQVGNFSSANNMLVGTLKKIAGVVTGALAINGLKDAYTQCEQAAENAQESNLRFTTLMKNVPGTTQATINSLTGYAGQLANVGVVSQQVSIAGAGQLATFQLNGDAIKTLLPSLDDLIVSQKGVNGTQQDAIAMANLVGKAMTGNAGALTRYGVTLTAAQSALIKTGTEQQKAAAVAQALEANYGNLNKAMTDTAAGGAARMQNQITMMKASIGEQLMPVQEKFIGAVAKIIPTVTPILTSLAAGIGKLAMQALPPLQQAVTKGVTFIQSHMPQIKSIVSSTLSTVGGAISQLAPIIGNIINFISSHKALVGDLTAGILIAVGAIKVVTIAQAALNVVMALSPVGAVIVGIGILVGTFIYLWNTCKPFRDFWIGLWDGMKTVVTGFAQFFEAIGNGIVSVFKGIVNFFVDQIDGLLSGINAIGGAISSVTGLKLSIPLIPHFALGTSYFRGGAAIVGEQGPELVTMPKGAAVHTASETSQMMGGRKIDLTLNVNGAVIRNDKDIDKLATAFVTKLQRAYDAGMVPA